MQVSFNNNKQNFGWKPSTHAMITEYAVDSFPKLKKYKSRLSAASQLPDVAIYDFNLINPLAHFYFGRQIHHDGFPKDAFSYYIKFFNEYMQNLLNNKEGDAMTKAGEALHFIQDIANPLHTNEAYQGLLSPFRHAKYEKLADKKAKNIRQIVSQDTEIIPKHYKDNFLDTYRASSTMEHPFSKTTRENWDKSIDDSFTLAYNATRSFLDDVNALLDTTLY